MPGFIRIALLALLAATLYAPLKHELNILGVLRSPTAFIAKDQEFYKIADTVHCEDLHYYDGKIFTACEDSSETRFGWFPPLVTFTQLPKSAGSIHVIDPKVCKLPACEDPSRGSERETCKTKLVAGVIWCCRL